MTTPFIKSLMLRGQQRAERVNPTRFTVGAGEYVGVFNELPRLNMGDAGYDDRDTATLVCSEPQFLGMLPQLGQVVTINGRQWEVSNKPHMLPGSVRLDLRAM